MSGFLDQMAASSTARYAAALAAVPLAEVRAAALARAPAPPLRLDGRFDLIAELKLRSPALGQLGTLQQDDALEQHVAAYARGGAAAVSVLTEPDRFDGSLEHLRRAVAVLDPLGVPAMRKDFLVAPYQLYEARATGAGGALLIVSQFTLYGDAQKGRRPSFIQAAHPDAARSLYEQFIVALRERTVPVETGEFGADMQVELVNDGPVTLSLER